MSLFIRSDPPIQLISNKQKYEDTRDCPQRKIIRSSKSNSHHGCLGSHSSKHHRDYSRKKHTIPPQPEIIIYKVHHHYYVNSYLAAPDLTAIKPVELPGEGALLELPGVELPNIKGYVE